MASLFDHCYAYAAQVVAPVNNMPFLADSLDKLTHERTQLTEEEIGGPDNSCGLSSHDPGIGRRQQPDHVCREQRPLLNVPLSTVSLFGVDLQAMIERLEAAKKASEQLASHFRPQQQQQLSVLQREAH